MRVENSLFFLAGIVGAVAMAYSVSAGNRNGVVRPGAFNLQDAAFCLFGIGPVGACAWRAVTGFSAADWRLPQWFATGAFIIYAEVFNVVPMKEFARQIALSRHHFSSPFYKAD